MPLRLLVGAVIGILLVALAVPKRILTPMGAALAFLMLLAIIAFGGYAAAGYMIAIFGICIAVHLYNKKKKNRHSDGARGLYQVACNGLVGVLSLIVYGITGNEAFLVAYYAAIAEMLADTLASDIGTLFPGDPIDICRFRRVPRGRSGGVSLAGTAVSILGCLAAFLLALPSGIGATSAALAAIAAFGGMLFDSILGSLIQAKFRCRICRKYTENSTHCGAAAEHTGGVRFIRNSDVNLIANVFSAALAALLYLLTA